MQSPIRAWCVQAVVVSVCGVGGYSSVMPWMVVGVVRAGRDLVG